MGQLDQKVIDQLRRAYDPAQDKAIEDKPKDPGFLWKIVHLDPVLWRGAVFAIIGILTSFGMVIADSKANAIVGAIIAVSALVQAVWTRDAVTANQKVVVYKPDPVDQPNVVMAGPAVSSNVVAVANAAASSPGTVVTADQLPFPSEATN